MGIKIFWRLVLFGKRRVINFRFLNWSTHVKVIIERLEIASRGKRNKAYLQWGRRKGSREKGW